MKNRQGGVTLLETMVAITILGIVLAWGMPSLSDVVSNNSIKSTADMVFSSFQEARSEAMNRNTSVAVVLTSSSIGLSSSDGNFAKTISLGGTGKGTTITQSNAGAITFTSTGQTAALTSFLITIANPTCAASNACLNVQVYSGGFIKVCNPTQGDANATNVCPSPI